MHNILMSQPLRGFWDTLSPCAAYGVLLIALLMPAQALSGTASLDASFGVDTADLAPALERSAKAYPKDAGIRLTLGGLYITMGQNDPGRLRDPDYKPPDYARAEEHLNAAASLDKTDHLPHYMLGLLEVNRGRYDKALAHILKSAQLGPGDTRSHMMAHTLYMLGGEYGMAVEFIEATLKSMPKKNVQDRARMHHRMAISYLALKNYPKARESAKASLGLRKHPETMNLLGASQMRLKDYKAAKEVFREALGLDPRNVNAMIGLGKAYNYLGWPAETKKWLERALAIEPDNQEAREYFDELFSTK